MTEVGRPRKKSDDEHTTGKKNDKKNHTTQLLNISSIIHYNKVFLIESHSVFFLFFLTRSRSLVTWEASKYMLFVARNNLNVRFEGGGACGGNLHVKT